VNLSGEAGKEALEFRLDSRVQSDARGNTHCFSALVNVTEMKADTQRRLAREQLLRKTLTREVHHRIKNHLHSVMGLLYCCKENHLDPSTVLDKAIGQISSIATVYGLQSRDSTEQIRLTELLRACVEFYAGATEVQVSCQAADDYMNPEETVPVALILNELMANAVKHTTNGARDPSVKVALNSVGDTIQLNISNPCDGLPEDLDIRSGTGLGTGLELLRALLPRDGIRLDLRWRDGRANADLVFETPILWRQAETPVA
jgi:two-component sensor histidine kinase